MRDRFVAGEAFSKEEIRPSAEQCALCAGWFMAGTRSEPSPSSLHSSFCGVVLLLSLLLLSQGERRPHRLVRVPEATSIPTTRHPCRDSRRRLSQTMRDATTLRKVLSGKTLR